MWFFFKQNTAYEMRISDWSSDVCSSDLHIGIGPGAGAAVWRPVCESLALREKQRPLVPEIVADPPHVRVARDVIGGRSRRFARREAEHHRAARRVDRAAPGLDYELVAVTGAGAIVDLDDMPTPSREHTR